MNFLDALNVRVGDIEKPLPLPNGTYVYVVTKAPKESTRGDFNILDFPVVPKEPFADADDVDADELAAFGDLKSGVNRVSFLFPTDPDAENDFKKAMNNLKRFLLDTLRVDGDDDSTIKELMAKCVGAEFIGQSVQKYNADKDDTFVNITNMMPRD